MAGIEASFRKKKVGKTSEVIEESISRTKSWIDVELSKEIPMTEVGDRASTEEGRWSLRVDRREGRQD